MDGSVHVQVKVTLGSADSYFRLSPYKNRPVVTESIKAWDAETGEPLDVILADKGTSITIECRFGEKKNRGYQFFVEFERLKEVEEDYSDVYSFDWNWLGVCEQSANVILPKGQELLCTEYSDPEEVLSLDNVQVIFEKSDPEEEEFPFGVVFSWKGVQLVMKAENYFDQGQYAEAKEAYEDAVTFYSQFPDLYGKDISFLAGLKKQVDECDFHLEEERIQYNLQLAEEKFQEAQTAFNDGDYRTADQLFKQAQTMYNSAGNSERAGVCQEYINQCSSLLEKEESRTKAEILFNEGIAHYEREEYDAAKSKFEASYALYRELGDEEKINKCEEWIDSCEEALESAGGFCFGTALVIIMMAAGLYVGCRRIQK